MIQEINVRRAQTNILHHLMETLAFNKQAKGINLANGQT